MDLHNKRTSASAAQLLVDLKDTGTRMDRHGLWADWADRPGQDAKPVFPGPGQGLKKKKTEFTNEEELALLLWCSAAEKQGMLGGAGIFEQFACYYPQHSWQAYEGKWRKGGLSARPQPSIDIDRALANLTEAADISSPNLDTSLTAPVFQATDPSAETNPSRDGAFVVASGGTIPDGDIENTSMLGNTSLQEEVTYSDFRVDILSNIPRLMGFEDEDSLANFVCHNWIRGPLAEFAECYLDAARARDLAYIRDRNRLPKEHKGPHRWKIARAIEAVQSPGSRYLETAPDKTLWTDDDHEIRFIARITDAAMNMTNHAWACSAQTAGAGVLAERSFWLAIFARWAYKPTLGRSANMQTLGRRKQRWMNLMSPHRGPQNSAEPSVSSVMDENLNVAGNHTGLEVEGPIPTPIPVPTLVTDDYDGHVGAIEESTNDDDVDKGIPNSGGRATSLTTLSEQRLRIGSAQLSSLPLTVDNLDPNQVSQAAPVSNRQESTYDPSSTSRDPGRIYLPQYRPTQSKVKNQQRGISWLTEDGYQTYKLYRDRRLTRWGVTADHQVSCVLIPADWAESSPEEVMDGFQWNAPVDEGVGRLKVHIGDMGASWARASAWFEAWPELPRRGADLDGLLTSPDSVFPEMHGSHLCHHGWCVSPSHLVYETGAENMSRIQCAKAASNIRAYDLGVPPHCRLHDPPCLMQQASLTTKETLAIQFSVFRRARGAAVDAAESAEEHPRPRDHPRQFSTFESRLPTAVAAGHAAPTMRAHLAPVSLDDRGAVLEKYKIRCRFCPGQQRSWRQITAYWSHVRALHPEVAILEKLSEIRRSAAEYGEWIASRGFDYEKSNAETWFKMQQTQATNFDWEVVKGWRMAEDRRHERYQALNPSDL